jgi:septal ring factor EnvC (AmiA/AmiB activator)
MGEDCEHKLAVAIHKLAASIDWLTECLRSHSQAATKNDLKETEKRIMATVSEELAAVQANLDTVNTKLDDITTGIAALDALITGFQNSPGTLSAADQAALDKIQAASNDLAAKASAVSTTPPAPPTP